MLGYNVGSITLLRYYAILLYMSLFFAKLLPYYAITRLFADFFLYVVTLLLCYVCIFHYVYVITSLRYYTDMFFRKLSRYYLITLLHDSLRVHSICCYLITLLRTFLCRCVLHFLYVVTSLYSFSVLLPSHATMDRYFPSLFISNVYLF